MIDALSRFPIELWQILLELSPSLLLGLFIAGLVHVYVPAAAIHKRLSRPDLGSVVRASLLGVPLPLCSCGVIPTALGLRKAGASPGATTSFMISTPQTGVDSVLVSAAFLGWPFALFKLGAAFITGVLGGVLVNGMTPPAEEPVAGGRTDLNDPGKDHGVLGAVRYAVLDLLAAIDLWLIAGVLVAALVTTLVPADFFVHQSWSQGLGGMLVVLAISLPLYVCTTASVPIAASLIAAGMPAGSALVFLMAGPATNVATIGAVYRTLGLAVLGLYLGTVVVMSLGFGLVFDQVLVAAPALGGPHAHGGGWLSVAAALVLLALLAQLGWRRWRARRASRALQAAANGHSLVLQVQGMSCQHCVGSVKRALEAVDTVTEATPDLASGRVRITGGGFAVPALVRAIEEAGFTVNGVETGPRRVDASKSVS